MYDLESMHVNFQHFLRSKLFLHGTIHYVSGENTIRHKLEDITIILSQADMNRINKQPVYEL